MPSEQRRNQNFVELSEVYKGKKEVFGKDSDQYTKKLISTIYEKIAFYLEEQLVNSDGGYKKLIIEISKQREQ